MKIPANRVRAFAARPDAGIAGFLLFGPEGGEVDALRIRLVEVLAAATESDLTRLDAQDVRRDPASVSDALHSTALFGGRPLILLENATDGLADALAAATEDLRADMAALVVTAGALPGRSKLRKLFEGRDVLAALGVYPQTIDRGGLEAILREEGVGALSEDAVTALLAFAATADASELRAVARTLSLYGLGAEAPLTAEDVASLLPEAQDGDVEAVIAATAAREAPAALAALGRVAGQGAGATTVAFNLGRQFRQLHALAAAPDGPEAAIARMRPPLYGPKRDALLRAARQWPLRALETVLQMILDTEFTLRSTGGPPDRAVVERLIVRICTLRSR